MVFSSDATRTPYLIYIEAINERQFDVARPPWTLSTSSNVSLQLTIRQEPLRATNHILDAYKDYTALHPSHYVNVTQVSSILTPSRAGGFVAFTQNDGAGSVCQSRSL